MNKLNSSHTPKSSPPPKILQVKLLPVLERAKSAYKLWHTYHTTLPKTHRYTLGNRVDDLFIEVIEAISSAAFLSGSEKIPYVGRAIQKLDTAKLLFLILWETKSLDTKKYIALSKPLDEVGRMLGGWLGQLKKKNSPYR